MSRCSRVHFTASAFATSRGCQIQLQLRSLKSSVEIRVYPWLKMHRVARGTGGGVRGWLFLAWVPQTFQHAGIQSRFLETQVDGQPGAGSAGQQNFAEAGVAGGEDLGARFAQARTRLAENSTGTLFLHKKTKLTNLQLLGFLRTHLINRSGAPLLFMRWVPVPFCSKTGSPFAYFEWFVVKNPVRCIFPWHP